MAQDVIISCFATPPTISAFDLPFQSKIETFAQPVDAFEEKPKIVTLSGIGSDRILMPGDTERKPREPWGGKPFRREAYLYQQKGGGSILRGLAKSRLAGTDIRRIALIGFSAGGSFVHSVLENEEDARLVDAVILLDAIHIMKYPDGRFIEQSLKPWVDFAWRAGEAGALAEPFEQTTDPFLGPLFVSAHTAIRQDAAKERIVGNTTDSTQAVYEAVVERVTERYDRARTVSFDRKALDTPPAPLPIRIGPGGAFAGGEKLTGRGVPAPEKTWDAWPRVPLNGVGLFYDLNYGGRVAADHVFNVWFAQGPIWRAFLAPRWNASRTGGSPYSVSGTAGVPGSVGEFLRCCPGPGGDLIPEGVLPTGWGWQQYMAAAGFLSAGFLAGKRLLSS